MSWQLDLVSHGIPFWMAARLEGGVRFFVNGSVRLPCVFVGKLQCLLEISALLLQTSRM